MIINQVGGSSIEVYPETISITPSATNQTIKAPSGYDAMKQVKVLGDTDLKASNIKAGVSIFGVTGNMKPASELRYLDLGSVRIKRASLSYSTIKTTYKYVSSYSGGPTFYTDDKALVVGDRSYETTSSSKYEMNYSPSNWSDMPNFMAEILPWTTGTVSGKIEGVVMFDTGYDSHRYDATFEGPIDNITVIESSKNQHCQYARGQGYKYENLTVTKLVVTHTP